MTDLEVWVIGTSMLLIGVLILGVSLAGLIALGRDDRRRRRTVEIRRLRDRQLQRDTEQAIRQVRQRYQVATDAAVHQTFVRRSRRP